MAYHWSSSRLIVPHVPLSVPDIALWKRLIDAVFACEKYVNFIHPAIVLQSRGSTSAPSIAYLSIYDTYCSKCDIPTNGAIDTTSGIRGIILIAVTMRAWWSGRWLLVPPSLHSSRYCNTHPPRTKARADRGSRACPWICA